MSSLKNCLIVKKKDIYKLKKKLKFKKSARIILHHKFPKQQEMIIAQKKHYYFPVKKKYSVRSIIYYSYWKAININL